MLQTWKSTFTPEGVLAVGCRRGHVLEGRQLPGTFAWLRWQLRVQLCGHICSVLAVGPYLLESNGRLRYIYLLLFN